MFAVSVELPETHILATQMQEVLPGKTVDSVRTSSTDKLQRIGFIHRDVKTYNRLIGETAKKAHGRGMTIVVSFSNSVNVVVGLEYGGTALYHTPEGTSDEKFHLKLGFTDGSDLTVRVKSMGAILVYSTDELDKSYIYKRDFSTGLSPLEKDFIFERLSDAIGSQNKQMKALLVGKDAVVVGFGNAAYQEFIYQAGIHPKRKGSELSPAERHALFDAILEIVSARLVQGGKTDFIDLYGTPGRYEPLMGPHMKGQCCQRCDTVIESGQIGGGLTFFCPTCQR